jgi:density-regulated protein
MEHGCRNACLMLNPLEIDLKKCSKMLASKFACSASISRNACNEDEIAIQGDFLEDVASYLGEQYPDLLHGGNIIREERKRK